jgi:RNA polymerase sigma-70 factor, ECF subfamily
VELGFPFASQSFDASPASGAFLRSARASTPPPPDGRLTDFELAGALIAGEPAAARVAIERFSPMVRGILRRGLGPDADVEDAFQEAFFCVFRQIPRLRDPLSLRAFILGITLNTLLHERRRRQKRSRITCDDELVASSLVSGPDEAAASYALLRLAKLLGRLGERERRAFVLRFLEGHTALESAKLLGVSEPTARRALGYASSRIRKWAARDPFLLDYIAPGATDPGEPVEEHF